MRLTQLIGVLAAMSVCASLLAHGGIANATDVDPGLRAKKNFAECSAKILAGETGESLARDYACRGEGRIKIENDHAKAAEDFRAALDIEPNNTHVRRLLADALLSDAVKQPVIHRKNLETIRNQLLQASLNLAEAARLGFTDSEDARNAQAGQEIIKDWTDFLKLFDSDLPRFKAKTFAGKPIVFGGVGGQTSVVVLWTSLYREQDLRQEFFDMGAFMTRHRDPAIQLVAVETDDAQYGRKLAKGKPVACIYVSDAGAEAKSIFRAMLERFGEGAGFIIGADGRLAAVLRHHGDFWGRLDTLVAEPR